MKKRAHVLLILLAALLILPALVSCNNVDDTSKVYDISKEDTSESESKTDETDEISETAWPTDIIVMPTTAVFNYIIREFSGQYTMGNFDRYYPRALTSLKITADLNVNDDDWDKVQAGRKEKLRDGYNRFFDEDEIEPLYYFPGVVYYNKAFFEMIFWDYAYTYDQLPDLYYYIKYYDVKKEDIVKANEKLDGEYRLTDEQIEVMFGFDDDAVRRELKFDDIFYYDGRLYNVAELILTERTDLLEMAENGDFSDFVFSLKRYAESGATGFIDKYGYNSVPYCKRLDKCADYLYCMLYNPERIIEFIRIGDDEMPNEEDLEYALSAFSGMSSYYPNTLANYYGIYDLEMLFDKDVRDKWGDELEKRFEMIPEGYKEHGSKLTDKYCYCLEGTFYLNGAEIDAAYYRLVFPSDQLPDIYCFIKTYNVNKDDLVRINECFDDKHRLTDKQIEVMCGFDDDAVRRELLSDLAFYYEGKIYNLPELLLAKKQN